MRLLVVLFVAAAAWGAEPLFVMCKLLRITTTEDFRLRGVR